MHLIVFANPLENDFATSVNSRVMKGHLKSEATLLIEIALVFARPDVFGSGFPIMDHLLRVLRSPIHPIMHMYSAQKKCC
jgi:hypothetical protein